MTAHDLSELFIDSRPFMIMDGPFFKTPWVTEVEIWLANDAPLSLASLCDGVFATNMPPQLTIPGPDRFEGV